MEHVIGGKFKLGKKIGSGSFGELYLGTCLAGFLIENLSRFSAGSDAPPFRLAGRSAFVSDVVGCFWLQASTYRAARRWLSSWYVTI
jgi:hypothetical protein